MIRTQKRTSNYMHNVNICSLLALFRIDRMTSGIVMFSKTQGRARDVSLEIQNRTTEKTYLARVVGEFPE